MKSLKLTDDQREDMTVMEVSSDAPQYPWGTRIHLGDEQVELFPELKKASLGDEHYVLCKVRIKSVSEEDEGNRVEMQITDMQFEGAADDAEKADRVYDTSSPEARGQNQGE